ncbi:MAG TPA: aldehyde-activating protein [Acidimicrobiaceae bacterium]|nr:aldehyde-activating protein [Acidimicrobiaceae bacterium]HCV34990.1 aldehyde-activating protein [Acidimicrobiaceae bacterium]
MDDARLMARGNDTQATGRCECGGVQYRVTGELRQVVHCHCTPCRRITGHHMAATATHRDDLHLDVESNLMWYSRTSEVRYGFCNRCGSTLFWMSTDNVSTVAIAAGTLDQPTGLRSVLAIYTGEASDFHVLDDSINSYRGDVPGDVSVWSGLEKGLGN